MSIINCQSIEPPFLADKGKSKLVWLRNMCTTPIHIFLQNTEQMSEILLVSKLVGVILTGPLDDSQACTGLEGQMLYRVSIKKYTKLIKRNLKLITLIHNM